MEETLSRDPTHRQAIWDQLKLWKEVKSVPMSLLAELEALEHDIQVRAS